MPGERPDSASTPSRPRWQVIGLKAARIVAIVVLVMILFIRLFMSSSVFFPEVIDGGETGVFPATPRGVQDVFLTTGDGVDIYGWYLPRPDARVTLLYFHGNAGNLGYRIMWVRHLSSLPANVLAIDYRGFGRSEGEPSEDGVYLDAKAAFEHLTKERGISSSDIVVYGKSLGGGPACWLAEREDVRALILQSTFTSVPDMVDVVFAPVPVGWVSPIGFDNLSRIANVDTPVLLIHSRADEMIPFRMAEELHAAAREPKHLAPFDKSGHNTLVMDQSKEVVAAMREFLATHAR